MLPVLIKINLFVHLFLLMFIASVHVSSVSQVTHVGPVFSVSLRLLSSGPPELVNLCRDMKLLDPSKARIPSYVQTNWEPTLSLLGIIFCRACAVIQAEVQVSVSVLLDSCWRLYLTCSDLCCKKLSSSQGLQC